MWLFVLCICLNAEFRVLMQYCTWGRKLSLSLSLFISINIFCFLSPSLFSFFLSFFILLPYSPFHYISLSLSFPLSLLDISTWIIKFFLFPFLLFFSLYPFPLSFFLFFCLSFNLYVFLYLSLFLQINLIDLFFKGGGAKEILG